MKIGVLIDRMNVGGVEKIAIEEVKALRAMGEDAELVVLRKKGVVQNAFTDLLEGVPVAYLDERMPRPLRVSFGFPLFYFFSLFHLTYPLLVPFFVMKSEYDYLIVHGTYTSLTAIQLKRRRNIPFSGYIWDPVSYLMERVYRPRIPQLFFAVLYSIAKKLDKYIIHAMNSVLVGGEAHNPFIKQIAPNSSIDVIYPSVHPAHKLSPKKKYIFVVTAWKEGKNPEYLIELSKSIPDISIKMGGKWIDPLYRDRFEDNLRINGVSEKITVLGELSEVQLKKLYGEALVVLQTNDDRGFGMPALEAAAHGTCFIVPEGQGVCSLFINGVHGYYTKEKDTKKIAELLSMLSNDTARATRMGRAGWQHAKKHYSWTNHAEQLINIAHRNIIKVSKGKSHA